MFQRVYFTILWLSKYFAELQVECPQEGCCTLASQERFLVDFSGRFESDVWVKHVSLYLKSTKRYLVGTLENERMTGWKIHHVHESMYFLLKMGLFQCHVSFRDHPSGSKWLGSTPIDKPWMVVWKGSHNPILRGRTLTMVINHLQVLGWSSKCTP